MATITSIRNGQSGSHSLLSQRQQLIVQNRAIREAEEAAAEADKNRGGFFGGLGYFFEKIGLGFMSGIEGIWDYTAGGLAKLFGADDWAEQQFDNDWVNYNHADEWYNPSDGWKTAGDVAGGIGTSLPAIVGVAAAGAIAYFSGGTLSGVSAAIISGVIAGLGAAGNATKEAYRETGELDGKAFGYGALVGLTEGTIEGVSAGIGAGTGAIVKNMTKSFGKQVAGTAVRQTIGKTIVKSFVSEAFEEGVAEILDPYWKRITYDPDAENATFQEVAYASLVGGLSGALMGGFDASVRNIHSTSKGKKIAESGKTGEVIATAENISAFQTENQTEYESVQLVNNVLTELKTSLESTNGEVKTWKQQMLLGALEKANTSVAFEDFATASAFNILNNAEAVAERMNAYGYTDANGNKITVTAEQLRAGIDTSSPKKLKKSVSRALRQEGALRSLAILDATGRLTLDTAQFTDATLRGQQLSSQADLNRFVEQADEHELTSVGEKLGISDWNTITNEQFQEKITQFVADGGVESYRQEHTLVQEARTVDPTTAKGTIPRMVNLKQDGSYRYTQGNIDLAIVKRGDSYRIFDYESGRMSKPMSRTEINKALKEIRNTTDSQIEAERQFNEKQEARKRELEETDTLARENIDGYANLSAPNQAMIRLILRQAKASGLTQDFALTCARISARSGLNIVFSKEMSFVAADGTYADGAIDLKHNRIIVNPESKNRSGELILIHELTHAIYKSKDGVLTVAEGVETMSAAEKEKIRKRYAAVGQGGAVDVADEINANFAEQTLSNKNILERLVAKKPTIKDKILSFFTKAKTDYQGDTKLTGAAARLFKQYQKLFDSFAESNYQRNSMENPSGASYRVGNNAEPLRYAATDKSFAEQVDEVIAGTHNPVYDLLVGDTPKVLQDIGFENKPLLMRNSKVKEILAKHPEISVEIIKKIPQAIADPVMIIKSKTNPTESVVAITDIQTSKGEMVIPVWINQDGTYLDVQLGESVRLDTNFVASAYGRNTKGLIEYALENNEVLFYAKDKKRVSELLATHGLRLPARLSTANFTNSISENSENVNPKKAKTTKKFALPMEDSDGQPLNAAQREFFADSKVVDEQGRLRKVYHGTGAEEFFTFDKSLSGRNYDGWSAWGRGFYFAGNTKSATRWAGKSRGGLARVVECYLNLTNPFMLNADAKNTALGKHLRKEYNLSEFDLARGSMVINFLNEKNIDVAELLQRFGYDGVIAPDYNEGGDYMVIEPNQIKLTTNKNPSKQDDIRYALEIDGEMAPVDMETSKNLVALHNLSAEKLQKSIELGGFPMPSIAITTTELAHNNYGGITVVFGRETIDPETDSRNVVYDRDAWTPTKPRVDVKLNEKRVDSLIEELSSILKGTPYDRAIERFFDGHYRDNNGDYVLSDFDYAKEHIGANAYGNNGFLAAYLAEKGIDADIEPIFVDKGYLVGGRSFSKRELSEMLEAVGISKGQTRENTSNEQRAQMLENYIRYESRKRGAFLRKKNPDITEDEIVERYRDDYGDWHVDRLFVVAEEYFDESRSNSECDEYATRDKLKRKITDKEDFYSWVWDKIQTTYEKRGIDNESDVFDSRGNRRSFEQRHFNYTVQNIVKAMSKGEQEGVANAVNAGALAAKLAKQFVSVEDIREAKDYLALVSEEDMKAFNSKTYKLYDEIVTSIVGYSSDFMRDTNRRNDVGEIIGKCATERPLTVERIKRRFANETKGYNPNYKFNDKIANMVLSLFEALRHIPTTYFEAKPRRAISFSEVKNIILPKDTDAKLISSLKKNGIPYTLYDESAGESRSAIIKRMDGIRFALPDTDSDGRELSDQQRKYFEHSKIVDEKGRLLVVYHGSPVSDITKFRLDLGGAYFTSNLEYAKRYAGKQHDGSGRIYECYLNIKKPFDTRKAKERRIFNDEFYGQWGNGAPLSQRGLPDWTDGDDLVDFIQEKGYDYDGIILDEGADGGYGEKVVARGVSYVVFNEQNQVKLATNNRPTSSSDIRYALTEDTNGNVLSAEQRRFFADSKIKDVKGRLRVLYHGTNADFTVFDSKFSTKGGLFGVGFYFGEEGLADTYGKNVRGFYLNIKNPYSFYDKQHFDTLIKKLDEKGIAYDKKALSKIDWENSDWDAIDILNEIIEDKDTLDAKEYGEYFTELVKEAGYDGIDSWDEVVAFSPEQAKLTTNKKPTSNEDVRYALPEDGNETRRGGLSRGQRAQFVANNTGRRVYSRTDAESVISDIIDHRLAFDEQGLYGKLRGKNKAEITEYLWRKLNTTKAGYRAGVALKIADYMIENSVFEDIYADTADVDEAMTTLTILRRFLHNVDLHGIASEVQYRYDKKNTIFARWGAPKGEGVAPDTLGQLLEEDGIYLDAINGADMFFQMLDIYENARATVNTKVEDKLLSEFGSQQEIETLRQTIAKDILAAYDQKGKKSKFANLVEKYTNEIQALKKRVRELTAENRLMNSIIDKAQKFKDMKLGTFLNATQYKSDVLKKSVETLSKIKYRGNFNIAGTRKIMGDLRIWYSKDNPMLQYVDEKNTGYYEQGIADMLDTIAGNTKGYTKDELQMIDRVMSYFINFIEHYNKVYRNGKWIDAIPEATRYVNIYESNEKLLKGGKISGWWRNMGTAYMETFADPMSVARRMDMYENGFFTEMLGELRDAAIEANITEMQIKEGYDAFVKKNKKYLTEIEKKTVEYRGVQIPRAHIIGLYMTLKRTHSHAGFVYNGFNFTNTDGKIVNVAGSNPNAQTEADVSASVQAETAALEKLLTDTDREFISILERGFNQDAKQLKIDRDMQRYGFTNAMEGYYYPIRRAYTGRNNVDLSNQSEFDRVSNSSFNKDTVQGAKQKLHIESADVLYNRHIHAVCQYAALAPAIENYNRLYNLDISGNPNDPTNVKRATENIWKKGNSYMAKLVADIQGVPSSSGEGMRALGILRSGYAKYQLGANPKVWLTQLSSFFASSSILDADSIAKGMFVSARGLDTYCPLAKLRNSDNSAAMAQGVIDKVGKVGNVLMKPIGVMDRFVVSRLFGACQVQVQKNGGAKVGTEANKVEAGKLLSRVILETQQNAMATERSAAMRSGNEIMRTLTMFTSDGMKVIGRVIDSFGELSVLRAKYKAETDVNVKAELKKQIKTAKRKVRKSLTALMLSALFMAAIAQLFKHIYNKDRDEDESIAEEFAIDFVGNLMGGLPLIKDVYARIFEGWDIENYSYSAINDLLDSAMSLFNDNGSTTAAGKIKNLANSLGQLTGIPTRNIYNVFYGLTKRFDPEAAYKIDSVFYKKNYRNDLKKAVEKDDTEMIGLLMSLVLNENVGSDMTESVRTKLADLYKQGYSVLPRTVNDTITYNGAEIELNDEQLERFNSIYTQANNYLDTLVNSYEFRNNLTAEQQAKAIKALYEAYYSIALTDLVGADERTAVGRLANYISADKLAVVYTVLSGIESDKDKEGKTVSGSRKKKIIKSLQKQKLSDGEKLLMLCYSGYAIQDGDYKGYTAKRAKLLLLKYILGLKVSKAEKAEIAKKCGFTVKNGTIVRNDF